MYSPGSAESIERLNRYLRNDSVIGRRLFELCAIIGAWEIEQQYEWSGHEPAALQFGVSQKAVDIIKFNRPIEGLPEDETVVIQMGRQILREHGGDIIIKSEVGKGSKFILRMPIKSPLGTEGGPPVDVTMEIPEKPDDTVAS